MCKYRKSCALEQIYDMTKAMPTKDFLYSCELCAKSNRNTNKYVEKKKTEF